VSNAEKLPMQTRADTKRCNNHVCVCVSQNLLSNILPSQDENQPTTRQHAATAAGQKCAAMTDTIDLYQCCMQTDCCVCTRMVYL